MWPAHLRVEERGERTTHLLPEGCQESGDRSGRRKAVAMTKPPDFCRHGVSLSFTYGYSFTENSFTYGYGRAIQWCPLLCPPYSPSHSFSLPPSSLLQSPPPPSKVGPPSDNCSGGGSKSRKTGSFLFHATDGPPASPPSSNNEAILKKPPPSGGMPPPVHLQAPSATLNLHVAVSPDSSTFFWNIFFIAVCFACACFSILFWSPSWNGLPNFFSLFYVVRIQCVECYMWEQN